MGDGISRHTQRNVRVIGPAADVGWVRGLRALTQCDAEERTMTHCVPRCVRSGERESGQVLSAARSLWTPE